MPMLFSHSPNGYLKTLANRPSGLPLRLGYDLWHARNEHSKVLSWSSSLGIPPLSISQWRPPKGPEETLYLLGNGESVELLSDVAWGRIGQGFSIGINAWPIHEFVPNAYAFEPFDPESLDYVKLFSHVLHETRIEAARPRLLLFRPHSSLDAERYLMIPAKLRQHSRLYGRVVPSTNRVTALAREIHSLHQLIRARFISDSLVVDLGGTVIRLISLGIQMGFRNIVLVGVDLNGGSYFWERNASYLERRGLGSFSTGFRRPVHETMMRGEKAFIAYEVIEALHNTFDRTGGSLKVAHSSSALADFLPIEEWGSTDS